MVFFWFTKPKSQTQEQQKEEETQREEKKEKEEEKKKQLEKEKEETKKKKEEDLKKKMEEQKKTQGLFIEIFCRTAYLYLVPLAPVLVPAFHPGGGLRRGWRLPDAAPLVRA